MSTQMRKKIAMICAQYPPNSGPGPTRMIAFAKGLAANGYSPHVFTSEKKSGTIAARWRKLDNVGRFGDEMSGVSSGRGKKQPWYEMLINFFVPMEPTWTLSLFDLFRVFKPFAQAEKPSAIFTTSNPLASAVGGACLKRRHKVPLIVEFRDPWTLNPVRNWPTRLHFAIESKLEKWILRSADAVVMNTPTARSNLLNKYAWLDENKVHVVSHGYDGEAVYKKPEPKNLTDIIHIAYAGGFYMPTGSHHNTSIQGFLKSIIGRVRSMLEYNTASLTDENRISSPKAMLRAISEHNTRANGQFPQVRLDFIGGDSKQLSHLIHEFGLKDAAFILPRVATLDIRKALSAYDILYLTNPSIPSSPFVGTKTFDYLAAGRPIIAELPKGNQAQLITAANMGWITTPGSKKSILAIFDLLFANNCQALRDFEPNAVYIAKFSRTNQIADLSNIIEQITGSGQSQSVISSGYGLLNSNQQV